MLMLIMIMIMIMIIIMIMININIMTTMRFRCGGNADGTRYVNGRKWRTRRAKLRGATVEHGLPDLEEDAKGGLAAGLHLEEQASTRGTS